MKPFAVIALVLFSVSAQAAQKPAMKISDPEVRGAYKLSSPQSGCEDEGRGICESASITKKGAKLYVEFADGSYSIPLAQKGDVLAFSGDFQEDCDNPGCGNVEKIFGVVYFKKFAGAWVRTIKVNTVVDFRHPESEGDPEGLVTSTAYLTK